jgi:hypothetical protein
MTAEELLAFFNEKERHALGPEDQAVVRESYIQHVPPTEELRALTRKLFARARMGDGRILRRQAFEGATVHESSKMPLRGWRRTGCRDLVWDRRQTVPVLQSCELSTCGASWPAPCNLSGY